MSGETDPRRDERDTMEPDGGEPDAGGESNESGGRCVYDEYPGTVTVTSIEDPAPAELNNCTNQPVVVNLLFSPDLPDATPPIGDPLTSTLTVFAGANPPASCLDENGIVIGTKLPAVMGIIETGTCSPVTVNVELTDLKACQEQCYQ